MSVAEWGFAIGLGCGILGCVAIVLTDRADRRARHRATRAYWAQWGREAAIRRTVSQLATKLKGSRMECPSCKEIFRGAPNRDNTCPFCGALCRQ